MRFFGLILIPVVASIPALLRADISTTIDFETFPGGAPIIDSTPITTQFPGLTFTNTTVISAGIGDNEFEAPPHSGSNVAFDDGGPISILFATPITSFSGYFTYYEPLTIDAFNALSNQVADATSTYSINVGCDPGPVCLGDPGSSPNEFLQVNAPGGIVSVTVTGDPAGDSFVMDDITYTTPTTTSVPEPGYLVPFTLLFVGLLLQSRKRTLSSFMSRFLKRSIIIGVIALLLLTVGVSLSYFYVPLALLICPPADSTMLYVSASADVTQKRLDHIARSAGAAVTGLGPEGVNTVYPLGTVNTPIIWLMEVPCVTGQPGTGEPAAIRKVEAILVSYPEIVHVLDPNAVSEGSVNI